MRLNTTILHLLVAGLVPTTIAMPVDPTAGTQTVIVDNSNSAAPVPPNASVSSNSTRPWRPPTSMPEGDEWYRPAPGYEQSAPRTILKTRPVPRGVSLDNIHVLKLAAAWQIQYRTTNSVGEPDVTVTTLMVPHNAKPKDLLTYHWFTDAAYQDCNPSLGLQVGTRRDNLYTQQQNQIVLAALSQGWYVNVPDDGGYAARFANGRYAGQATLDSLRAVKKLTELTGIDADPTIVTFGYSGGSIAGGWAAEMQPTYAPDVKLAGVAIGGIVANLIENMRIVEPILNRTAYSVSAIAGLARDFPEMLTWLDDNLVPDRADEFRTVFRQCLYANYDTYDNKSLGAYLKDGYQSLFTGVPHSVMTNVTVLGQAGVPTAPMYTFMVTSDEATPIGPVDDLIDNYCRRGADIIYERNPIEMTHTNELLDAIPGVLRWITDRFEGMPAAKGCQTYIKTSESIRGQQQKIFFATIAGNMLTYIGRLNVGPSPWTSWLSQYRPNLRV